ncbi:hypothetical protein EPN96_07090 [bacterium]|nr:MAG: hypothetical protein EPN96_07090 [bacterium]
MANGSGNNLFENFVEMDGRARGFLGLFYQWLRSGTGPALADQKASDLAHKADRYLRDFVVDILELAPEKSDAETVRKYLGNWYIINTLGPTLEELDLIGESLRLFHQWAALRGIIGKDTEAGVIAALSKMDFFHGRLESFWSLRPEGITGWRAVDDYRKPHSSPLG